MNRRSRIRGAVWRASDGTWWGEVYYARRRTDGTRAYVRAEADGDLDARVIEAPFATYLDAVSWATASVDMMRGASAAITAGKLLGDPDRTPAPWEAP